MTYAEKFMMIVGELELLSAIDESILAARHVMPNNGHLQLELDRRTTEIADRRRDIITTVEATAVLN